ncbi:hypothetical protein [Streptomyces sp. NPDC046685]|uniref:hypothetical protein n=1 Tax=Streptomyces sp. NPDC046685 TaxID=3157202 RepID=UPI00340D124C
MLYFKVVRRWWAVPGAVVVLGMVCWAMGGAEVPVPSFLGGVATVRVRYFAPLLVVIAVLYCLERRLPAAESTAVARIQLLDHMAVAGTVLSTLVIGLVTAMEVPRNMMILLALALVVRRFANEAAAGGACLMLLLGTAVLGRAYESTGHMGARWWALLLHPAGSAMSWAFAGALLAAGLLISDTKRRGMPMS